MDNPQLTELAFELLRIHLGRHDIEPDIDSIRSADKDGLVEYRHSVPVLTESGVETINRMVCALFEGMEAR